MIIEFENAGSYFTEALIETKADPKKIETLLQAWRLLNEAEKKIGEIDEFLQFLINFNIKFQRLSTRGDYIIKF